MLLTRSPRLVLLDGCRLGGRFRHHQGAAAAARFFADDFAMGFLVLDGLGLGRAGTSVSGLTFLLAAHVESPRIGCPGLLKSQPSSSASTVPLTAGRASRFFG